jgi:hypothetical protein
VPFNDPAALGAAVLRGLDEPARGVAARRRVEDLFTPARRQKILVEELEFVLGQPLTPDS